MTIGTPGCAVIFIITMTILLKKDILKWLNGKS